MITLSRGEVIQINEKTLNYKIRNNSIKNIMRTLKIYRKNIELRYLTSSLVKETLITIVKVIIKMKVQHL